MKKFWWWWPVLIVCVVGVLGQSVEAKKEEDKAEEERLEMRKKIEEKRSELNGSRWEITIKPQAGKGSLPGSDTLTFQDLKFTSKNTAKMNFPSTNYTLTLQEGGPTIWETMQTGLDREKDGVIFWRGEWKDDVMAGVIVRQLEAGSEDYSFTSAGKTSVPPTSSGEDDEAEDEAASGSSASGASVLVSGGKTAAKEDKTSEESAPVQKPKAKRRWL